MKLSLNWFRNRCFAASACVALIAIFPARLKAEDVEPDVLKNIGLKIVFSPADPNAMPNATPASATITATRGGLANLLRVPEAGGKLKSLEGAFGKDDTTSDTLQALISHAAFDGVISFTLEDGSQYSVPTKTGAEKLATTYGLAFGKNGAGTADPKVKLTDVSGTAAQSQLRKDDPVSSIDLKQPENALHAYALFFNAIQSNGRAVIQVGDDSYEVPQSLTITGLNRGVGGTGPQVQFPQFLERGSQPRKDSPDKSSSNEVITARVETYYFRDAHRLAQILNRGVKSYQAAAVSQLERAAENAGDTFEVAKSRRREAEFQAEQKAKELRQKKKELSELTSGIRESLQDDADKRAELEQRRKLLTVQHDQLVGLKTTKVNERAAAQTEVANVLTPRKNVAEADLTKAQAEQTAANTGLKNAKAAFAPFEANLKTAQDAIDQNQAQQTRLADEIASWTKIRDDARSTGDGATFNKAVSAIRNRETLLAQLKTGLPALTEARDKAVKAGAPAYLAVKTQEDNVATAQKNVSDARQPVANADLALKNKNDEIAGLTKEIDDLQTAITDLDTQIKALAPQQATGSDRTTLTSLNQLVNDVKALESEVATATLKARQANEAEELAAKGQFRAEVAAAQADPDTYAPGDMNSVDPVTQVSISVIGEGVLHLRGPRLGVVKLREMIHQLDHPVGQVKIGIMTVQLNGEQGHRMENTLRRMEGHLSRGRFLTYVSEQLLKRAIAETATEVAEDAQLSGYVSGTKYIDGVGISHETYQRHQHDPEKIQRWRAYVTAFFGRDFLEGLKDVDPDTPVLDPLNKLLSLSSADSLTLAEAMFVTGLAKHDVRARIVSKFRQSLICDLPQSDLQWIKVNKIKKGWNPLWWGEDCTDPDKVLQHAAENYTFEATTAFFRRDYRNDALNPLQREVIRLVQGLALERWLEAQRTELVQQRELVRQIASADWTKRLSAAEEFLVESEIDRLTEAHLDAMEAVRGRKAALDRLIKQIVIAVEDDCYAQFYNPAMERIRRATTEWDVELGSVERTTILTNNRAFGKVAPQATYQFDLPKRDILLAEAMQAAYALHQDLGPLVGDPNFATLTKMFSQQSVSGSTVDGTIKNVLPGLDSTTDQKNLLFADSTQPQKFGTELEKLIPDPAIYKFETGTGFEVRPVVQPDGQSVVFDFNYMYTTDLLEPTSPDERSLGRVKRHFVNTEVQLGNLEWREISRYEISLKAARNSRGVPLLEDIPVVGLAFRPLPQAKKSIQKNIIIGQAAVYPTIEDLLGLRSPAAAGLPVDELPDDLRRLREAQKQINLQVKDVLGSRTQAAIPISSAIAPPPATTGTERMTLPAPIHRLSYESPTTRRSASPAADPRKPGGSVPLDVASPRPSSR